MKKWLMSAAVLIATAVVTAVVGFFLAIFLVGPHSDLLPGVLRVPVGLLLWAGVIGIPFWLAYKTFLKCAAREKIRKE